MTDNHDTLQAGDKERNGQKSSDQKSSDQLSAGTNFFAFLPLILVVALIALFAGMLLSDRNPKEIKSVLIGQPAPPLTRAYLVPIAAPFDASKPTVVNFYASWCVPCQAEHESLIALSKTGAVNLIGIAFKDDPLDSRRFLDSLGNPYDQVIEDPKSYLAIGFGVSGVPETFVIDKEGVLRYRHWGPVVGDGLATKLMPEIDKWR